MVSSSTKSVELIHEGNNSEDLSLKDGTFPDPIYIDSSKFNIFLTIVNSLLEGKYKDKWNNISTRCMEVS